MGTRPDSLQDCGKALAFVGAGFVAPPVGFAMVKVEHSPQQARLDPPSTERDDAVHEAVESVAKSIGGVGATQGVRSDRAVKKRVGVRPRTAHRSLPPTGGPNLRGPQSPTPCE